MNEERKEIYQRHTNFLQKLKDYLGKYGAYDKGSAGDFGRGISDEETLTRYIAGGHFHKNFYTNYHALHILFCGEHQVSIPDVFYVYDIACGPYTATISLLNFLKTGGNLTGKSFIFTFCDRPKFIRHNVNEITEDNWLLTQLCDMNKEGIPLLSFPKNLRLFPKQEIAQNPDLLEQLNYFRTNIACEFESINWQYHTWQCGNYDHDKHDCCLFKSNILNDLSDTSFSSDNSINLIFCSYPGINPNYDKFFKCIKGFTEKFSMQQKKIPTYVIYSHYVPTELGLNEVREITKQKMTSISNLIRFMNDNRDQDVPFPNYYYCIFKMEECNATT